MRIKSTTKMALLGVFSAGVMAIVPGLPDPAHGTYCKEGGVTRADFDRIDEGDSLLMVQDIFHHNRKRYGGEGTTVITYTWGVNDCVAGKARVVFSKRAGQPLLVVAKRWIR